jgi:hypothetical protein
MSLPSGEAVRHAVTLSLSAVAIYYLWKELSRVKKEISRCQEMVEREKELRQVERKGRISVQQQKRHDIKKENAECGYNFPPIGYVESPFPDRRGTPRQPNLVQAATGRIRFDKKIIQQEHFKELEQFSHIWVIWVFHVTRLQFHKWVFK